MTGDTQVQPETLEEAGELLAAATADRSVVLIRGSGTRQGIGYTVTPDIVLSTKRLNRLVAWEPDDLTVVVEAGVTVEDLEQQLAGGGQSAILPEWSGSGTVGGAIAVGSSGWRRSRYGPIRDRVLETTLVTGDGRIVTAGGRLVKNVTGYDIPRLATGSFGSLGLIGQVCLKLWPIPPSRATVRTSLTAEEVLARTYRPQAVLETHAGTFTYLAGSAEQVEAEAKTLGADPVEGHAWPDQPAGETRFSVRVPPSQLRSCVDTLDADWEYVAQFGVGEVSVATGHVDPDRLGSLRTASEAAGGALVLVEAPDEVRAVVDPWGTPPSALALQARVIAEFDPARIINPGRLPGGL